MGLVLRYFKWQNQRCLPNDLSKQTLWEIPLHYIKGQSNNAHFNLDAWTKQAPLPAFATGPLAIQSIPPRHLSPFQVP